ncbi:MAG: DUF998 domain-containing protein [Anaerolineae bacterium]|nr:DUF998 domain-containing protein [Anaerolineae bacterium]MCI0610299.1 DUF998 domain-containing protein [Anaerolineae bacterium]
MNQVISNDTTSTGSKIAGSQIAARLSFASAVASLIFLAALHILSPEFDPSWRMVSEYANGGYGWVLSLMFATWAVSDWALAYAIWSQPKTAGGKIGLVFLIAACVGGTMGGLFDINHPLHGLAGLIGISSLPVAAMLISVSLARTQPWSGARKAILWTANLTWISLVLMVVAFVVMIVTFTQSGAALPAEPPTTLPPGVIGLVGWANRFLVVVYNAWAMTVAWRAAQGSGSNPS